MSYEPVSPWNFSRNVPGQQAAPDTLTYSTDDFSPDAVFDEAAAFFQGSPQTDQAPAPLQPTAYQSFLFPGVIALPAQDGLDHTIMSFQVPSNWDGFITLVANSFNGPGFIPGSGSLIWRILQNGQAVRDFDNIQVALGIYSPSGGVNPLRLADPGIPVFADDTISMVVRNVSIAAGASQIYALLGGYRFPSGGGQ